jgi:hypothetical protein
LGYGKNAKSVFPEIRSRLEIHQPIVFAGIYSTYGGGRLTHEASRPTVQFPLHPLTSKLAPTKTK